MTNTQYLFSLDIEKREDGEEDDDDDDHDDDHRLRVGRGGVHLGGRSITIKNTCCKSFKKITSGKTWWVQ